VRGERRCLCQGEILVMLGHYGWIMGFGEIDHPDVGKTAGRIYVHKRDVAKGVSLVQGDVVSFYLYVDDQGLGAEGCSLVQGLGADAGEFEPPLCSKWNTCAHEFVPTADTTVPSTFNVEATVFVPSQLNTMNCYAQEFVPCSGFSNMPAPNVLAFNPAFLLDDSDDESDDECSSVSNDGFSGNEADKESAGSDNEGAVSIESWNLMNKSWKKDKDVAWSPRLDAVVMHAPLKPQGASSDEDSTSIGGASDSEAEGTSQFTMRAPPGLSLPPGMRPPPGLSLPVCAA